MNAKEKWQLSAVLFFVLAFVYDMFYLQPMMEQKHKEYYRQFNSADIHGVFSKAEGVLRAQGIIVDGVQYVFRPYSAVDGQPSFDRAVCVGDSIIKKRYDKVLIVKKPDGTEYRYKFHKYE